MRVRVIKNLVFFLLAFLGSGMAWREILLNFLFSEECGVANGGCAGEERTLGTRLVLWPGEFFYAY